MLREIHIKNLAVIKETAIPFTDNLNILTGETGAGKSILINGINAVLGQRVSRDMVRTGCKKAEITALFTEIGREVAEKLCEMGIDCEEGELVLTREIGADGRSVARINGRTSSVSMLKSLGSFLINIHGQHDSQILLDSRRHIDILDGFGGDTEILENYRRMFRELQEVSKKLSELVKQEGTKAERAVHLKEIVSEIGGLETRAGEDDTLEQEYNSAKNAEKIITALGSAVQCISGEQTAVDLIASAERELSGFSEENSSIAELYKRLSETEIELADISSEIERLADRVELDGSRLEYISERLSAINTLKKKYNTDCEGLVEIFEKSQRELSEIVSRDEEVEKLKADRERLRKEVTEQAKLLFDYRQRTADDFSERVAGELEFLNMSGVVISVRHEKGKLTINGMDSIEFLISANRGEEPKPIAEIASGGELSRIMLALKSVIAGRDTIPTMIFDEIDTGVSGKAAQKIGIKLRQIGKVRQVICVTHLPQIAVMADSHLLIEKKDVDGRTETSVTELDFDGRCREVARIMGGENPSELMLETAQQEIRRAEKL